MGSRIDMVAVFIVVGILIALGIAIAVVAVVRGAKKIREENRHANCEPGMNWSERRTAVSFDQALSDCPNKLILNNLILPGLYDQKHTTQIDTLIVSPRGVFVIETKSWNGRVYGHQNQKEWAVYYENGESHKMYNPTWQNAGHVHRIEQLIERDTDLNLDSIAIIPMVVFFHGDISHVEASGCYTRWQALEEIRGYQDTMDDETIEELKRLFSWYKANPPSTAPEHARYVQGIKESNEE